MPKIILTLFACTFILLSCSKNTPTNVEYGNKNSLLFIANGEEPRGIDPHTTTGSPDSHVIMALFEGLTTLHPKTLKPLPGVAESWTISNDGKTYLFTLRPNAKWSNGDTLTAKDFVYAWKRGLTPTLANEFAYMMYPIKNAEAFNTDKLKDFDTIGVKAIDNHTLQVELNQPTPYFLELMDHHSFYPVHQKTVEQHGDIDDRKLLWTRQENMVSNGPFTLKNWEINKVIEVEKNPLYWDNKNVALNGIHFFPITEQQAEERAFRSGQVHLTYTPQMAIEKIAYYKKNNPAVLQQFYVYSSYYYLFNTTRKPFNDVRVRRALAMAIDRDTIVEKVSKGGEKPLYSFVPPAPEGYQPKSYFSFNVDEAKKLLSEAGYPNGEGFPTFSLLYNTHNNHRKIAVAIQQMLKTHLNIHVELRNEEWKVYLESQKSLDFELSRQGWIADYYDPSNFFEIYLSYSGNNHTGWKNDQYDKLIKAASLELDQQKRFELFEQANKIIHTDMPILPLYAYSDLNLVQTNVKGWHSNVLHRHHYKFVSLENNNE